MFYENDQPPFVCDDRLFSYATVVVQSNSVVRSDLTTLTARQSEQCTPACGCGKECAKIRSALQREYFPLLKASNVQKMQRLADLVLVKHLTIRQDILSHRWINLHLLRLIEGGVKQIVGGIKRIH